MYYNHSKNGSRLVASFRIVCEISVISQPMIKYLQIAMEFIGNYAKYGLTPYRYDMLVVTNKESASGGRQTLRDR